MSAIDITKWELHNLVIRDGKVRVRKGLFQHLTPTAGTVYVAGFSVESPSTTETWHYLVEQSTTSGSCTIRVFTEDMLALYSYELGVLTANPVFSYARYLGQLMINSPAMSAPLYGLIGGGLTTALKVPSINPATTAIDIPTGHICAFGNRVAIGSGSLVFISDPGGDVTGTDPRTFVAENLQAVDGQILDLVVGSDGALYVFTSGNVFVIPVDALSKGQTVDASMSVITGINPSRPKNAAASNGQIGVLASDGLLLVNSGKPKTDLTPYEGRRFFSLPIEVNDLRVTAQLFATSNGFLVGFTNKPYLLAINLRDGFQSYYWTKAGTTLSAVGVLRGRDGEDLFVLRDRVVQPLGNADFDGGAVRGVACGELVTPAAKAGVVRGMTVSSDSAGQPMLAFGGGYSTASTSGVRSEDVIVGTSLWSATGNLVGRSMRSTLHRMAVRDGDLQAEVGTEGSERVVGNVDVDVRGQARGRRDRT